MFDVHFRYLKQATHWGGAEITSSVVLRGPFVSVSVVGNDLWGYYDWHGARDAIHLATVSYNPNIDTTHRWTIPEQVLKSAPRGTLSQFTEWSLIPAQRKVKPKQTKRRTVILEENHDS
jgi:hypothetical protein